MNNVKFKNLYLVFWASVLMVFFFISCTPMDHFYKEYIEVGDRVYVGKIDSVWVEEGNERVKLVWLNPSDPSIETIRVYWNSKLDSVITESGKDLSIDTNFVVIEDLSEGMNTFYLRTFDGLGNYSLFKEMSVQIYGDKYRESLKNRVVKEVEENQNHVIVEFYEDLSEDILVSTEILYFDNLGSVNTIVIPKESKEAYLENINKDKGFKFRTIYKPTANAMDDFYTDFESFEFID